MRAVLWLIAAVVVFLAVPVVIGLCVRGDPDNATRRESGD